MAHQPSKGFTLSEVLIALALLGIIAAFAIPKVLQSTQKSERNAKLKEAIAVLSDLTYSATLSREVNSMADFNTFLEKRLNTLQTCSGTIDSCYPVSVDDDPGFVYMLPSGVAILDVDNYTSKCQDASSSGVGRWCYDWVVLDYNGKQLPNNRGEDRVQIVINVGPQTYSNLKSGQVGIDPTFADDHPNTLLFQELTR